MNKKSVLLLSIILTANFSSQKFGNTHFFKEILQSCMVGNEVNKMSTFKPIESKLKYCVCNNATS